MHAFNQEMAFLCDVLKVCIKEADRDNITVVLDTIILQIEQEDV
jgi:hypothetical protein